MDGLLASPRSRRVLLALLAALVVAGLAVAGTSALRLFERGRRPPPGPRQTDVSLIAGWMTFGYLARTYGVPPDELAPGLGVEPRGADRRSLAEIAASSGRSTDAVVAAAQAAVLQFQATHPDRQRGPSRAPPPGGAP